MVYPVVCGQPSGRRERLRQRRSPRVATVGGGGVLDYHNGSLQGGTRQLERSLRRADIILCPVNCNSHGACIKVKNLAKKHNKTFYMLPNGSLSTISRLLGSESARQEGERA